MVSKICSVWRECINNLRRLFIINADGSLLIWHAMLPDNLWIRENREEYNDRWLINDS